MPDYTKLLPVIQDHYYNCWAAAMSRWLHATSDRGRTLLTLVEVMEKFPRQWDKNGAKTVQGLIGMFAEPSFMMSSRFGNEKDMSNIVSKLANNPILAEEAFPIIVGYHDPAAGGNHVVVLCQFSHDANPPSFITMDPRVGYRTRKYTYFKSKFVMIYGWAMEVGYFF